MEFCIQRIVNRQPMTLNCQKMLEAIPGALNLISKMLNYNMTGRPSTSNIKTDQFFILPPIESTLRLPSGESLAKRSRLQST